MIHTKWKEPVTENYSLWFYSNEMYRTDKSVKTESTLVVDGIWGVLQKEEWVLMDVKFLLGVKRRS